MPLFRCLPSAICYIALVHALLCIGASNSACAHAQGTTADAIFYDGNILTGEGLLSAEPKRSSALAVRDGLILAVGSDSEVLPLRGPKTETIDLHGAFAMPGFNDAHVHLASAGREKLTIDLVGTQSLAEMLERIRFGARSGAPGTWLRGRGWDHMLWESKQLPTLEDLDKATGDHPALFSRVDGHISVANSRALALAHITSKTPDPPGGKIDRDAEGNPTGIVRETAVDLVAAKIPPATHAERQLALTLALEDAAAHGVTSVQDYSTWDDFLVFEEMERAGRLPIRVCEWLTFLDPLSTLLAERAYHPTDDPLLHTGMLKGFMDGSLGSRTAALKAPYSDDPGNSGLPQFDQPTLDKMTIERARAGFQIGFHAIGDRAVAMALDAFAAAEKEVPPSTGLRFRIEHDQVVDPADFARYKQLHVIASMQPNHLLTDMAWAQARIDTERARSSYPWKSFVDQGTPLPFGTDYPVEPITPFRGLYAALTRKNEAGTETYFAEEKLTVNEALYAYTQASAYAEFAEGKKGKLTPGSYADLVVLDTDPFHATPVEILHTHVLRTVVGGRTVYRDSAASK